MAREIKIHKMRNRLVDALKGYACFLVVFGHVIMGIRKCGISIPHGAKSIEEFIWTFHVALFMFLSGYVYNTVGEGKCKKNRVAFIKNKFINLIIPYITFSSIYIVINCFIGGSNVNSEMSISNILWLWKKPIAQYWFLYDLFFIFLTFTVLNRWLKNWQITFLLVTIKIVTALIGWEVPMPFAAMIRMALPFGVGASIKKLYVSDSSNSLKFAIVIMHTLLTSVFLFLSLEEYILFDLLVSIIGCFASVALISCLASNNCVNKVLQYICKYSFPVYLLHTIFTAGIRVILCKIEIDNYFIHVFVGCFCGFIFPIMGAKVCEKIDVLNFFFYPGKILKRKKNAKC